MLLLNKLLKKKIFFKQFEKKKSIKLHNIFNTSFYLNFNFLQSPIFGILKKHLNLGTF